MIEINIEAINNENQQLIAINNENVEIVFTNFGYFNEISFEYYNNSLLIKFGDGNLTNIVDNLEHQLACEFFIDLINRITYYRIL